MKRIWMLLSAKERLLVQKLRARAMTGYDVHVAYHPAKTLAEEVPFGYYIWPMGAQPNQEQVYSLAGPDPVQAARRFLKTYKAKHELIPPPGHNISYYARPEKR